MSSEHPFSDAVIVVADDDRMTREYIGGLLKARGYSVVPVETGQQSIEAVRSRDVDLVVLDVVMPGLSGIDACRVIKTITKDRFVPVVLLTSRGDLNSRVQGLRTGADDYISKPFEEAEFLARVENMLRIKSAHDNVQFAKDKLQQNAVHDELTRLPNHRYFHERLQQEFKRAERYLEPLACAILAINNYRDIVAECGPEEADTVLLEVSDRIRATVRETDIAARFRTAEFGLLLPNTSLGGALTFADRIINDVAKLKVQSSAKKERLSVSMGIGLYPSAGVRSRSELLDAASIAVARARVAAPNRVCVLQQQGYIFQPKVSGAA